MLVTAKPKLQEDLNKILYKAMYEAFMSTMQPQANPDPIIKKRLEEDMDKAAKAFATKAADEAAEPMATAIYDFVKEIGIICAPKALVSPMGPVTGTILENEYTIS